MLVPNSHLVVEEAREHCRNLQLDARRYRLQSSTRAGTSTFVQRLQWQLARGLIHAGEMLQVRTGLIQATGRQQSPRANY